MSIGASAGAIGRKLAGGGGIGGSAKKQIPSYPPPRYNPPAPTPTGRYTRPTPPPSESAGSVPTIKKPKPPPGIWSYLAKDSTYQDQIRNFNRSLSHFMSDLKSRKTKLGSEYGLSRKALRDQRTKDLESIEEDYASRGLLKSGIYGEAVGDYEKEYGLRFSDIARANKDALNSLTREQSKYKSQYKLNRQSAKEAAARRRAEKYGL